jgi:hypothetical protein
MRFSIRRPLPSTYESKTVKHPSNIIGAPRCSVQSSCRILLLVASSMNMWTLKIQLGKDAHMVPSGPNTTLRQLHATLEDLTGVFQRQQKLIFKGQVGNNFVFSTSADACRIVDLKTSRNRSNPKRGMSQEPNNGRCSRAWQQLSAT